MLEKKIVSIMTLLNIHFLACKTLKNNGEHGTSYKILSSSFLIVMALIHDATMPLHTGPIDLSFYYPKLVFMLKSTI